MFLLDSNILIYYLDGKSNVESFINDAIEPLYISVISITELLAKASLNSKQQRIIKEFLQRFYIIDLDYGIADRAAALKRKYRLKFPDAVVAATAINNNLTLLSQDKVFGKIRELQKKALF